MTQTTLELTTLATSKSSVSTPPIQLPTSCSNCPNFQDYQDNRGRGWCNLLDRVSFKHHTFTSDCQNKLVNEEDILRSEYEPGTLVKLIDSNKSHTEWTSFIVVGKRHNPHRYRTTETFLNQTDWYYLLATIEEPIFGLLWVAEDEICHHSQAYIIDPAGVF